MTPSQHAPTIAPRILIVGHRFAEDQRPAAELAGCTAEPSLVLTEGSFVDADAVVLALPAARARQALDRLVRADPSCLRIVVAERAVSGDEALRWLDDGADAILPRLLPPDQLRSSVIRLLAVRRPPTDVARIAARRLAALQLSETELDLVVGVLRGGSNAALSRSLGLSRQSVRGRLHTLFKRLGIDRRSQLFPLACPL